MSLTNYFDVFGNRVNPGQFFFGGGKAPSMPKQEPVKMPATPAVTIPKAPPAPAPIPPSPTTSNLDVQQQQDDTRKQAAQKKGVRQTLIAGETGGYMGGTTTPTKKTLLG